jgi:hypothetical protein
MNYPVASRSPAPSTHSRPFPCRGVRTGRPRAYPRRPRGLPLRHLALGEEQIEGGTPSLQEPPFRQGVTSGSPWEVPLSPISLRLSPGQGATKRFALIRISCRGAPMCAPWASEVPQHEQTHRSAPTNTRRAVWSGCCSVPMGGDAGRCAPTPHFILP